MDVDDQSQSINYISCDFIINSEQQITKLEMYQKSSDQQFEKIIGELGLKVRSDPADREQLKYILMEVLGYPSTQKAIEHHEANRLGTNDLLTKQVELEKKIREKDTKDLQICDCCGLLLRNQQLPYSTALNQLNLGIGVYLFFKDFLYYALVFSILFFIYSIYAIATNSIAFSSAQSKAMLCNSASACGFSEISAGAKVLSRTADKNKMSEIQAWLGVVIVIVWGILQIIKTHLEEKLIVEVQTTRVSASDFTLMIKHFPKVHLGQTEQESFKLVQNIFNQYFETEKQKRQCLYPYEIASINIARSLYMENRRNVEDKEKVAAELYAKQNVFRKWIEHRRKNDSFSVPLQTRNQIFDDYQKFYSQKFEKQMHSKVPLQQMNTIFVTMRYSKARQQIQHNNAPISILGLCKLFRQSQFPVQGVKIRKASEPEEIMWNNMGFPSSEKNIRRLQSWLATLGLIGVSLALSIGISYIKEKTTGVSIGISIIVTLVNYGIQIAMMYFSYYEHETIESWQQSSIALKIGIAQLVNSIGVPIVVTAISKSQNINKPWLKANGLADDVFFIALLNLLVPLSSLIDFYQHWLRLIRWWKSNPQRKLHMFGQKQLNYYYGNYKLEIGYEYAFLIKTSIFTAFFLCMQPIIALFAPFALAFYYFANKRNLFYHFNRPRYHFETTNKTVDIILVFSLLAFSIGSLFVNNANPQVSDQQPNNTALVNAISIIISCLFLIVVPFRIFYCCIQKPELENKDYNQKKMLIYTNYDRTNPVTKNRAISDFEDYIKGLEQSQGLPNEAQLVKLHVSTIQKRETIKPQNNLGKSFMRMSMIRQQSMNEPNYNYDLQFYEQIAHQSSIHMGIPPGSDLGHCEETTNQLKYLPSIQESKRQQ